MPDLPTIDKWLRETAIPNERKGDDPILTRIDTLVNDIPRKPPGYDPAYLHGELFYACDQWLKNFKLVSDMRKRTKLAAAVQKLYAIVAEELRKMLVCPSINHLQIYLERMYGRELTKDGLKTDLKICSNTYEMPYMERSYANEFRVFFIKGLAYQFEYGSARVRKLLPAESSIWYDLIDPSDKGIGKKADGTIMKRRDGNPFVILDENWSMFVMGMYRDIYMGPHMTKAKGVVSKGDIDWHRVAQFHSSWLGGKPVQCAGSLLIEKGIVKGIRNNSGHYQPPVKFLELAIEHLLTVGQDIRSIKVYDFDGAFLGMGDEARAGRAWSLQKVA
jgi:hypothetical protein